MTEDEYLEVKSDSEAYEMSLDLYSDEFINSVLVFPIENKRFIVYKEQIKLLPEDWMDRLKIISKRNDLENPVYVEMDENFGMIFE